MYKVRIKKACGGHTPRKLQEGGVSNEAVEPTSHMGAVPREEANIEVEKGESAFGDIDGDSFAELMFFGGKRHHSGGTPVNVPPGTFIFSDTKSLKIKDPELLEKFFGIKNPKKKGYTPAEISKQYKDFNKHMETLKDENADQLAVSTSFEMVNNITTKLGALALVQESMKGFPDGIPSFAESAIAAMGIDPQQLAAQLAPEQQGVQQAMGSEQGMPVNPEALQQPQMFIGGQIGKYMDKATKKHTANQAAKKGYSLAKHGGLAKYQIAGTTRDTSHLEIPMTSETTRTNLPDSVNTMLYNAENTPALGENWMGKYNQSASVPQATFYQGEGLGASNDKRQQQYEAMMKVLEDAYYTNTKGQENQLGKQGALMVYDQFLDAYENPTKKNITDAQNMLDRINVEGVSWGWLPWTDQNTFSDMSTILEQRKSANLEREKKILRTETATKALENYKRAKEYYQFMMDNATTTQDRLEYSTMIDKMQENIDKSGGKGHWIETRYKRPMTTGREKDNAWIAALISDKTTEEIEAQVDKNMQGIPYDVDMYFDTEFTGGEGNVYDADLNTILNKINTDYLESELTGYRIKTADPEGKPPGTTNLNLVEYDDVDAEKLQELYQLAQKKKAELEKQKQTTGTYSTTSTGNNSAVKIMQKTPEEIKAYRDSLKTAFKKKKGGYIK